MFPLVHHPLLCMDRLYLFDYLIIVDIAGVLISIWFSYAQLHTPNYDDSLAIYNFTIDREKFLANISNNIIPYRRPYVMISLE